MAASRTAGPLGPDPFGLCALTPGPLGWYDAASPDAPEELKSDTPGPLGCNDHAQAPPRSGWLDVGTLHLTLSWDSKLGLWDYDPQRLLDDARLCSAFVEAAHSCLADAVRSGLRPRVHEAHRSPEESDRKRQLFKAHKGGRAAAAWRSCHNYGIAMDVWLYDGLGHVIDIHVKGWYGKFKALAGVASAKGFFWGEGFGDGDSDHFEFHPAWPKGADGSYLLKMRQWALQAAMSEVEAGGFIGPVAEPAMDAWLPHFWWAAGAGGAAPNPVFLAANAQPSQA
jgi:hypothetical protein